METKIVVRVNKVDIISTNEGMIPVKPICEALGIAYQPQMQKLKEDEDLSSVVTLSMITGSDGKQYEMVCLPCEYIYGWLFTINPKNVKPEAKDSVRKYRMECYQALYKHFFERQKIRSEQDYMKKKLLEELNEVGSQISDLKHNYSSIKRKIERIREERLSNDPMLDF